MKKIKELKFVQIQPNDQKQIKGGCFSCGCCIVCTCFGTEHQDQIDSIQPGGGSGGSKPNPCNNCVSNCMPGDNADFANWVGTKMAQQLF